MLFRQFVNDDLGCASYLIGDEESGEAVVVDPAYAVEQYLERAKEDDVRLVGVLETHTHADHVSGHGRLALEHGAARLDSPGRRARISVRAARRRADRSSSGRCASASSTRPATGPSTAASR